MLDESSSPLGAEPSSEGPARDLSRARVMAGLFGGEGDAPVIPSRFETVRTLGSGAMGDVVLAKDTALDRLVAIKRLGRDAGGPDARRRVLREARALARLQHPNVVMIYDVEVDGGEVVLAMEYVEGSSLRRWLAEPQPVRAVLDMMLQAARGLAAIHAADLVHRDFKPDNVLIGDDGIVRVADLGLARPERDTIAKTEAEAAGQPRDDSLSHTITREGALVGTPRYMAPEQLAGGAASSASDQFAFGVTLYECLFNVRPFAGDTVEQMASAIAAGELQTPTGARRVPRWLRVAAERMLSVDPADRYPSMEQVVRALDRSRRQRKLLLVGLGGAVIATGSAFLLRAPPVANPVEAAAAPCPRADAAMAEIWNAQAAEQLRQYVQDTVPQQDAQPLAAAIDRRVRDYTEAWIDEHQTACRATRVQQLQTEGDLERRWRCLSRARETMRQLLLGSMKLDAKGLTRLPKSLLRLQAPVSCASAGESGALLDGQDPEVLALLDRARAEFLAAAYDASAATLAEADARLPDDASAAVRAELAFGRAEVARGRSDDDAAIETYLAAVELAESARNDRLAATIWLQLVSLRATESNDAERADFYLARARAAVARMGTPPEYAARLSYRVGQTAFTAGEYDAAVAALQEARALHEQHGADALVMAPVDMDLGRALTRRGDYPEAIEKFRAVATTYEAAYGPKHPRVASALNNVGAVMVLDDQLDAAVTVLQRSLEIRKERLGPQHLKVGQTLNALAGAQLQQGDNAAAITTYRGALEIITAAKGAEHPAVAIPISNIGRALSRLGRHDEAVVELQRAVAVHEAASGPKHPDVARSVHGLAAALVRAERAGEAVPLYRRALAIRSEVFGDDAATTAMSGVALAEALRQTGANAEALTSIDKWLPVLRAARDDEHPDVVEAAKTRKRLLNLSSSGGGVPR